MSLRLERQSVRLEIVAGENTAQSVVEGSVTLPASAPEVGRALRVRAFPQVTGYDVADGGIAFEGKLDVDLLYASFTEVETEGVDGEPTEVVLEERLEQERWLGAIPFALELDVIGAEPDMPAKVDVTVDSINFEVQGDQRTVNVDVVLNFRGIVYRLADATLTTRVLAASDIDVDQHEIRLRQATTTMRGQARVEGFLPFGGRALPAQVLELSIWSAGTPITRVDDGVCSVQGMLHCFALYTAPDVGAAVAEWTGVLPYEVSLPLPGAVSTSEVEVAVSVIDPTWRVVTDEFNRGLAVEATVMLTIYASQVRPVGVVTGIQSSGSGEVAVRTEPLLLQEAVGEGSLTTAISAALELPSGSAPVERPLQAEAKAQLQDIHVLGDRVALEGSVTMDMVYVGRSGDATSLATVSWPAAIPFDLEVLVPGAEPGLERRAEVRVERVTVDLINRETIEGRVELSARVSLTRPVELELVVEAVEIGPVESDPPTYTFVVLQEGDTLWQLAQRYHTEVADILRANGSLEDENSALTAGTKLCIPRRK